MVLTLASSWWRTEVYLDSVEDEYSGRRFDIESASVLIEPGKGSGSLYGSEARFTEVARLALLEGRIGVDDHLLHWLSDMGMPSPMLTLYTAYALAISMKPDIGRIRALCEHMRERWTARSADVKLLEAWCSASEGKGEPWWSLDLAPDEIPMIAYGWDLSARLANRVGRPMLSLAAQYHIGMWRTSSALWTQTQVALDAEVEGILGRSMVDSLPRRIDGGIDYEAVAGAVSPLSRAHSPLQQALRRALIDARDMGELASVEPTLQRIGAASGVDANVVRLALEGLLVRSSKGSEEFEYMTV